jgi:hypothetical protein
MTLLDQELYYLDATDVVIEADFREQDIRIDGMPRSNARQPEHPGVRIAFGSIHGPLIYGTDSCALWQHNVRSIALGLEALRAVDRYGVTRRGEQYAGWKALPSGIAMPAAAMTRAEALTSLGGLANVGRVVDHPAEIKSAYRAAARRHHPDASGQRADWDRLENVMRTLGRKP